MHLNEVMPHLLYTFKDERDLLLAIEEISLKFTKNRESLSDYLHDPRLTSAYTAFYLTTNFPKLKSVFEWMDPQWLKLLIKSAFIDLGAGPGTFSLAFREWAGEMVEIHQIETSALMRDQALKLWKGLYPNEQIHQQVSGKISTEKEKFLLFGHSANEMGSLKAMNYIKEINPEHILFIEPGTKDFFPHMLEIRKELIQQGFNVLYPCPTAHACPLKNSSEDWCHQFIHVRQDVEVERISQMARKDRRSLPLIVHGFSKSFSRPVAPVRIIRVFAQTKYSFEWEVCENNEIRHFQIMKRGLSKKDKDLLEIATAGDQVEIMEVEKVLETGKRIKLKSLNNKILEP